MRLSIAVLAVLITTGCGFQAGQLNQSSLIKDMAGDPATFCANAVYAGASLNVARTNITNGEVQCTPQGMIIKSNGVTIPATVTVGQPVIPVPTAPK